MIKTVIDLAIKADTDKVLDGIHYDKCWPFLERFAKEVLWSDALFQSLIDGNRKAAVLAEREACAKLCEEKVEVVAIGNGYAWPAYEYTTMAHKDFKECAAAIRARGE